MTHRASAVAAGAYSGQPACTVQLQLTEGTTTAGMFGVMATNPMSRIGELGPENTSLTAATIDPLRPDDGATDRHRVGRVSGDAA